MVPFSAVRICNCVLRETFTLRVRSLASLLCVWTTWFYTQKCGKSLYSILYCELCGLHLFGILKLNLQKNSSNLCGNLPFISYRIHWLYLGKSHHPYFRCLNINMIRQFFRFLYFQQKKEKKMQGFQRSFSLIATQNSRSQDTGWCSFLYLFLLQKICPSLCGISPLSNALH